MYISLFTLVASASLIQAFTLQERALYASGGWGLAISNPTSSCPSGTQSHSDFTITICCPNNFTSSDTQGIPARICCSPGKLNIAAFIVKI